MPEGFTGQTVPLPADGGYGNTATPDTQNGQDAAIDLIPRADLQKMQSIKDRELSELKKQLAERDGEMTRLQQERVTQEREVEIYTALRRQGYSHADAQEEAQHSARYEVENHFKAVSREKELETYKSRDERARQLATMINVKKEVREEFGLTPEELDVVLKDLTGDEPNYESLAWKLGRSAEKQKQAGHQFIQNRGLRDAMPVPGAGMGAKTPAEILNPPPGAKLGSPEYEAYLAQKREYLRENRESLSRY